MSATLPQVPRCRLIDVDGAVEVLAFREMNRRPKMTPIRSIVCLSSDAFNFLKSASGTTRALLPKAETRWTATKLIKQRSSCSFHLSLLRLTPHSCSDNILYLRAVIVAFWSRWRDIGGRKSQTPYHCQSGAQCHRRNEWQLWGDVCRTEAHGIKPLTYYIQRFEVHFNMTSCIQGIVS